MKPIFVNESLNFGAIEVSGADAISFLQGQLTCDVRKVTDENSLYGAHCNIQGRIIFLCKLFSKQNNIYLVLPSSMINIALDSLKKFVLRSKVSFRDATKDIEFKSYIQNPNDNIAWIVPETSQKYLPHDLNYVEIGAISFDKGCYIGQEIIARMHYRAELKKQLVFLEVETTFTPHYNDKLTAIDQNHQECHFEVVDFQHKNHHLQLLGILYQKSIVPISLKLDDQNYPCQKF